MNQSITKKITTITAFLMLIFSVNTFGQIQPDVPTDAPPIFEKTISDVVNGPYEKTIEFTQNEDEFTVFEIAGYGVNTYEILNKIIDLKELYPYQLIGNYGDKTYLLTQENCRICKINFGAVEENTTEKVIEVSIKKYAKNKNTLRFEAEKLMYSAAQIQNRKDRLSILKDIATLKYSIGEKIESTGMLQRYLYEKSFSEILTEQEISLLLNPDISKNRADYTMNLFDAKDYFGVMMLNQGEYEIANEHFKKTISEVEEILKSDTDNTTIDNLKMQLLLENYISSSYTSLSEGYIQLGLESETVLPIIDKALYYSQKNNKYLRIVRVLNNWGFYERQKNNLDNAIAHHKQALELIKKEEFRKSSSPDYINSSLMITEYYLAVVSAIRGRYYYAIKLINNAENIAVSNSYNKWIAHIKAAKGRIFLELDQFESSIKEYEEAWNLYENLGFTDQLGVISINLGRLYAKIGNNELALEYINKSYEIFSEPKDLEFQIKTLTALATSYLVQENFTEANITLEEISLLSKKSQDIFLEGRTLTHKAEALIGLKRYKEAAEILEKAIELQHNANDDLYFTKSNYLIALALSKINNSFSEDIKYHLEKSKKTIEAIRKSLSDDSLRQQYFALQKSIYELEISLHMLQKDNKESIINALVAAENFRARTLYESIITPQKDKYNEAINSNVEIINSLKTVINNLEHSEAGEVYSNKLEQLKIIDSLNKSSVVLYFFTGKEKSFSWLISKDFIKTAELPSDEKLSIEVEKYINTINHAPAGKSAIKIWEDLINKTNKISTIIIGPYQLDLKNYKNLIISPDGPLHRIPYVALNTASSDRKIDYLINNHAVSYIQSLSILSLLNDKTERSISDINLLLVSNPEVVPDISEEKYNPIYSLPSAQIEAQTISNLWYKIGSINWLDGELANKDNLVDALSKNYGVIHFATHALADWDYPGQSSITLSNKNYNKIDPNLTIDEIRTLSMESLLVVLSACDTARGKQIEGEGPIGLSRTFLASGANRVIASLWPIDDSASSELMEIFYQNLFLNNENPIDALANAQNALKDLNRWSHPYYWAGFNFYGRTSNLNKQ